jgi:hypothetical protein
MSGYALEPAGIYGQKEITAERLGLPDSSKKKINPDNIRGVIIRVTKDAYPEIVKNIQPVLSSLGHEGHWTTGSAGSWNPKHPWFKLGSVKKDAGDIDVHVNAEAIRQKLKQPKGADEKAIRAAFAQHLKQSFEYVTQTGEQVHVAYPSGQNVFVEALGMEVPAFYQIDFPTTMHADTTYRHHEHEYAKDYKWDGQDQQMAISSLTNSKPGHPDKAHLYYGMGGALKNRGTGEVQERNIDAIAQRIFADPNANQEWLATVDRILDHLPGGINSPRLAQFRADMTKKYPDRFIKEGTVDWFANLRSKLNVR